MRVVKDQLIRKAAAPAAKGPASLPRPGWAVPGISSHYANLSVATKEAYRRQGLALLTCTACIEHTLERGLMPTWDTDEPNLASAALALKLGFEEEAPFSQLSPDEGGKLVLSKGLWSQAGMTDGIVTWFKPA